MHERKAYFHDKYYQDPMAAIMSVLWKIAMMQEETALSLHANSTGRGRRGLSGTLCHLSSCYFVGVSWAARLHCPSSLL